MPEYVQRKVCAQFIYIFAMPISSLLHFPLFSITPASNNNKKNTGSLLTFILPISISRQFKICNKFNLNIQLCFLFPFIFSLAQSLYKKNYIIEKKFNNSRYSNLKIVYILN